MPACLCVFTCIGVGTLFEACSGTSVETDKRVCCKCYNNNTTTPVAAGHAAHSVAVAARAVGDALPRMPRQECAPPPQIRVGKVCHLVGCCGGEHQEDARGRGAEAEGEGQGRGGEKAAHGTGGGERNGSWEDERWAEGIEMREPERCG